MAYLQSVPDDPNWPKDKPTQSRMQIRQEQGIEIEMPEIEHNYLIGWLQELGIHGVTMNGIIPLEHREIESWINLNGVEITHWEAGMLRKLSSVYCSQHLKSKDLQCEEPFETEVQMDSVRDTVDQKIRNLF